MDRPLVERMIALNHRFAGLLAERRDLPLVELYLSGSGPGYCLHETLAGHDRRTRQLLDWVHEVGRDHRTSDVTDLVHGDYHPGNILAGGGRIIGPT